MLFGNNVMVLKKDSLRHINIPKKAFSKSKLENFGITIFGDAAKKPSINEELNDSS